MTTLFTLRVIARSMLRGCHRVLTPALRQISKHTICLLDHGGFKFVSTTLFLFRSWILTRHFFVLFVFVLSLNNWTIINWNFIANIDLNIEVYWTYAIKMPVWTWYNNQLFYLFAKVSRAPVVFCSNKKKLFKLYPIVSSDVLLSVCRIVVIHANIYYTIIKHLFRFTWSWSILHLFIYLMTFYYSAVNCKKLPSSIYAAIIYSITL